MVVSPISSYRTKIALTIAKLDRFIHENVHMVLKVVIWMLIRLWLSGRWCGVTWIGGCWVTWLVFSDQLRNILSYYILRHYHSTNSWLTATIIWFLYEEFLCVCNAFCLQCGNCQDGNTLSNTNPLPEWSVNWTCIAECSTGINMCVYII
jgi:hypothetical protein